MRYILAGAFLAVLVGGVYWYGLRAGWFAPAIPMRLPTAEERRRMEEVERSSSQIAPNAVPGAGVRPRGSLPPHTEGTTSASSTLPATTTAPSQQ